MAFSLTQRAVSLPILSNLHIQNQYEEMEKGKQTFINVFCQNLLIYWKKNVIKFVCFVLLNTFCIWITHYDPTGTGSHKYKKPITGCINSEPQQNSYEKKKHNSTNTKKGKNWSVNKKNHNDRTYIVYLKTILYYMWSRHWILIYKVLVFSDKLMKQKRTRRSLTQP